MFGVYSVASFKDPTSRKIFRGTFSVLFVSMMGSCGVDMRVGGGDVKSVGGDRQGSWVSTHNSG